MTERTMADALSCYAWQSGLRQAIRLRRCPRCGSPLTLVEVAGHSQCLVCKSVIEDCCQGAPA